MEKNDSGSVVIASFIGLAIVIVGGFYFWQKNQVSQLVQPAEIITVNAEGVSANAVVYEKFTADDIGLSFDVPAGAKVTDDLNGFPNSWKFIYNNNSYMVFYGEFRDDKVNYDSWTGKTNVTVIEKPTSKIYIEDGLANTEVFFLNHNPVVTISVIKQEGASLAGETSSSDNNMYQHLVYSLMFEGVLVF